MKSISYIIVILITLNTCLAQNKLDSGLMLYLPLNGNAKDISGFNRNGLVNGPILTNDKNNQSNSCYFFDGKNDFISFPVDSLLTNHFTYSLWLFPISIPELNTNTYAIAIGGESGGSNIALTNTSNMKGWFGGSYNIGSPMLTLITTGFLPANSNWYHIVLTRDSFQMKLFVNGVLNSNIQNINGFNDSTGKTNPKWGISPGGTLGTRMASDFFHGKIDEVKIFNRAITNDEVSELFQNGVLTTRISNSQVVDNHIVLFPIPTQGKLNLFTEIDFDPFKIKIFNAIGLQVDFNFIENNSKSCTIDLSEFENGIYYFEIEIDGFLIKKCFQVI